MIRPNAILVNVPSKDGRRWNVVYIRNQDGSYSDVGAEYKKTESPSNLDPFVNWLDYIPNKEWAHPVHARVDGNGGWHLIAFDTFREVRRENESITLATLNELGLVFEIFDKFLDSYKNMSDEELLTEISFGREIPWTKEEFEKMYF